MNRYYYKLSTLFSVITLVVCAFLVFAAFMTIKEGGLMIIIGITLIPVLIIAFGYMPYYLEEHAEYYKLRLMFFTKIFRKDEYEVKEITSAELIGSIRTFGSGGLFGLTGHFGNRRLGNYQAYLSSYDQPMLLFTKGKKKVVINAPQ